METGAPLVRSRDSYYLLDVNVGSLLDRHDVRWRTECIPSLSSLGLVALRREVDLGLSGKMALEIRSYLLA